MVQAWEVLMYLRPDGGMLQTGTDYEGIEFVSCEPFTKQEYENAFVLVEAKKAKVETDKAAAKTSAQTKLAALGLTADEVAAIVGN